MSQPNSSPVMASREGGVVTLSFNRPASLNALDLPSALAFLEAVRDN